MPQIMHTQRNTEMLLRQILELLIKLGNESVQGGYFLPVSNDGIGEIPIPPANSIYYNTTTGKLNYRDFSNVDHDLY